jgi:hypothetical protein
VVVQSGRTACDYTDADPNRYADTYSCGRKGNRDIRCRSDYRRPLAIHGYAQQYRIDDDWHILGGVDTGPRVFPDSPHRHRLTKWMGVHHH